MATDKMVQTKRVYDLICSYLDGIGWTYERHDDEFEVSFTVSGEDLNMPIEMYVNSELQIIELTSKLSFLVKDDALGAIALAVIAVNNSMYNGWFTLDDRGGEIEFKMANCFCESVVGKELIRYMISVSCDMIDKYNDKFFCLSKGVITLEQFFNKK